uniref:atherin-like n=1 Tax=Arvicanthis niloticus TaxID=61156 RepID=UPI00148745FB|nr:atherin-like [Arvicanthis niloticus]
MTLGSHAPSRVSPGLALRPPPSWTPCPSAPSLPGPLTARARGQSSGHRTAQSPPPDPRPARALPRLPPPWPATRTSASRPGPRWTLHDEVKSLKPPLARAGTEAHQLWCPQASLTQSSLASYRNPLPQSPEISCSLLQLLKNGRGLGLAIPSSGGDAFSPGSQMS